MSELKTFYTEVVDFPGLGSNLKTKQEKREMPDDQANSYAEKHGLVVRTMMPNLYISSVQTKTGQKGSKYTHMLSVDFIRPEEDEQTQLRRRRVEARTTTADTAVEVKEGAKAPLTCDVVDIDFSELKAD